MPQKIRSPRAWAAAVLAEGVACIVDVETTGFEGSIVEIAAIDAAVVDRATGVLDAYDELPKNPSELHG